jgi:hypothetical protein
MFHLIKEKKRKQVVQGGRVGKKNKIKRKKERKREL